MLSLAGLDRAWAMPVRYRNQELLIACLVPRWAETSFYLEQRADALLVIPDRNTPDRHWLACRGRAELSSAHTWPELLPCNSGAPDQRALYDLIQFHTTRLDLIDERAGWGRRENLDLA